VDVHELVRLRDAQSHRGPDDAGLWTSADRMVGLAHRRLAIIDLSPGGHQPKSTPDGHLTITFNGEIYNHLELRRELEGLGERFLSSSDTEVILLGYRRWGHGVVDRLRGMFAFGIWDSVNRELFLARDPLGIKPLYYAEHDGRMAFASEVRALGSIVDLGEVDATALSDFLLWGSITSPATLHTRARSLEPGQWMRVHDSLDRTIHTYWRVEDSFGHTGGPYSQVEAFDQIAEALRDSVRNHLIADVPVGAFLSGGVDSVSLVALLMEIQDRPISTVTLSSTDDPTLDESRLAARAAKFYGTEHHEIRLDIEEIRERIEAAADAMDQPTVDGINSYLVSEAAHRAGLKVAVSGVGGDELFGGYTTFRLLPRILAHHRRIHATPGGAWVSRHAARLFESPGLPRSAAKLARMLAHGATTEGSYYACRGLFSPDEVRSLLRPDFLAGTERIDPARRLAERIDLARVPVEDRTSALEVRQYLQSQLLRDTDAASMAHSLEVRTPLVDRTLLELVARIPASVRLASPAKRALRTAPRRVVPPEIWNRKKQGFTIPFDRWLRSRRLDLPLPTHPAFDPIAVADVARRFHAGELHWSRLWALMVAGRFLEAS
jgi:asparagine synthase (glutamine-hydrolysing)